MHYERMTPRGTETLSAEDYEARLLGPLADEGHEPTAQETYSALWRWWGAAIGWGQPEPVPDDGETVAEAGALRDALLSRVSARVFGAADALGIRGDFEARLCGVSNAALVAQARPAGHNVTPADVEAMLHVR